MYFYKIWDTEIPHASIFLRVVWSQPYCFYSSSVRCTHVIYDSANRMSHLLSSENKCEIMFELDYDVLLEGIERNWFVKCRKFYLWSECTHQSICITYLNYISSMIQIKYQFCSEQILNQYCKCGAHYPLNATRKSIFSIERMEGSADSYL